MSLATLAVAQPNPMRWSKIRFPDGGVLEFRFEALGLDRSDAARIVMVISDGAQDRQSVYKNMVRFWRESTADKWTLLAPVAPKDGLFTEAASVSRLWQILINIRKNFHVDGNRIHLLTSGDGFRSAVKILAQHGYMFDSLTAINPCSVPASEIRAVARSANIALSILNHDDQARDDSRTMLSDLEARFRNVSVQTAVSDEKSPGAWATKHAWSAVVARADALVQPQTPEGEVGAVLDRWHNAAATANQDLYFGSFAKGGVFIGTDPEERWDVDTFRIWAAKYFKGDSAWVYIPTQRNVVVSVDRTYAWFDEVVWNNSYGECRGTGVLQRLGDAWKIAQYNLSIPVPNDVMNGVVRETRRYHRSIAVEAPADDRFKPVTVYLVRHAEKIEDAGDKDPVLTKAGQARANLLSTIIPSATLDLIVSSEYERTRLTAEPAAKLGGQVLEVHAARDSKGLARQLRSLMPGATALVVGHSNTVGAIIRELGVKETIKIADSEYDNLFIVTVGNNGVATLQRLRYGSRTAVPN